MALAEQRCAAATISSSPSCVLAATQTGRLPIARLEGRDRRRVGGERRRVEFEIAGDARPARRRAPR